MHFNSLMGERAVQARQTSVIGKGGGNDDAVCWIFMVFLQSNRVPRNLAGYCKTLFGIFFWPSIIQRSQIWVSRTITAKPPTHPAKRRGGLCLPSSFLCPRLPRGGGGAFV